jgi:pSer/pThr/pTyr-binding forkhead associated (FHA) protein
LSVSGEIDYAEGAIAVVLVYSSSLHPDMRTRADGGFLMPPHGSTLGVLRPLGGGDPITLKRTELVIGRRPSCDVSLDFANVSGKHCVLKLVNQVWHVRDLGSTNGTTVNSAPISSEHSVMPDDELGIAGHLFRIDYEPGAPESILNKYQIIEETMIETRKKTSLMELAGLDTDDDKPNSQLRRPKRAPAVIERLSAEEGEFDDALPAHLKSAPPPAPPVDAGDDDFFKLIEEETKTSRPK